MCIRWYIESRKTKVIVVQTAAPPLAMTTIQMQPQPNVIKSPAKQMQAKPAVIASAINSIPVDNQMRENETIQVQVQQTSTGNVLDEEEGTITMV